MTRGLGLLVFSLALFTMTACDQVSARIAASEGYQAYIDRQFEDAITYYEEAREDLPNNKTLLRNLGYACFAASHEAATKEKAKSQLEKATKLLTELLAILPNDRELLSVLVDAWEQGDHLEQAAAYFLDRVTKNPKDLDALRMLGIIDLKRGDYQGALDIYAKRKVFSPDDLQIDMTIAQTCWQYLRAGGPNDAAAAVTIGTKGYEAAMAVSKKEPKNMGALVYAGLLLRERAKRQTDPDAANKDVQAAEEISKRVKALNPVQGTKNGTL
jgi:tetratricopeptide (TPR) repeat protein